MAEDYYWAKIQRWDFWVLAGRGGEEIDKGAFLARLVKEKDEHHVGLGGIRTGVGIHQQKKSNTE